MTRSSGLEYRFLPEGPGSAVADIDRCADAIAATASGMVVASGSLPRGAPMDSFARLAHAAAKNALPFILDTSGAALRAALEGGGIHLVKPSLSELESIAGTETRRVRPSKRRRAPSSARAGSTWSR